MSNDITKAYVRIPVDLDNRLNNYIQLHNMSKNELLLEAITLYLDVNTGLYDFNDPALQRLNQMVDAIGGLSKRQDATRDAVQQLYEAFVRYTSGDNYLD